jgi:predicted Zn-dependent protease
VRGALQRAAKSIGSALKSAPAAASADIAADAGYDPRSSIDLWTRMASQSGAPPEFLSTHPSENTRIARLQKMMPQLSNHQDVL